MKTAVVVTAGRRRHRTGYIYGKLPPPHPLVTKVLVFFPDGSDAAIPIGKLALAGQGIAQLELSL